GGSPANCIAKWNGSSWSALGSGITGGPFPTVVRLAIDGTDLYVGGKFTSAGGYAAVNIYKRVGTYWSALGAGLTGLECGTIVTTKYPYSYVTMHTKSFVTADHKTFVSQVSALLFVFPETILRFNFLLSYFPKRFSVFFLLFSPIGKFRRSCGLHRRQLDEH